MVRIVAVSDTHGRLSPLERVAERVRDCDLLVHLGDGVAEAHELQLFYPDRRIVCVGGNGDWSSTEPETKELIIGGKRLFLCHGHTFGVKHGLDRLVRAGKNRQADLVLFGHTHTPFFHVEDGLTIVNPGSLGRGFPPSYAVIDIVDNVFVVNEGRL